VRFIVKRSVIVLLSAAALTGFASLASAQAKIGVVITARLMQEAPQARAADNAIRAEFAPREKEVNTLQQQLKSREEKLQKDAATMSELQRSAAEKELRDGYRELKLKQDAAEEDFTTRRTEEMSKLQRVLLEEVQVFAKAQSYDLIIAADSVLYAAATYDVTNPVLEALKRKAGPAAAAPAPAAPRPAPATPAKP
jgi:outer membrane protein